MSQFIQLRAAGAWISGGIQNIDAQDGRGRSITPERFAAARKSKKRHETSKSVTLGIIAWAEPSKRECTQATYVFPRFYTHE